jgi:hypothetical protein
VWSPADLAILVPMLGRAHRVEPLLASIGEATPAARVLFLVSPEDVDVHDAIDRANGDRLTVPWRPVGDYARKINEGVRHTTEALLFTGADDLRFHRGWFEAATRELDKGAGVVGTWDRCNRRTKWNHSTHSLLTRDYAEMPTIDGQRGPLFEGYVHEFVDDELIGTAVHRRAYRHCRAAVVEHLHPMAGRGVPVDELYAAQAERMAASRQLFKERRRMWE